MTDDLAALRLTADLYARGIDRGCPDDWRTVLDDNIVITGPGFVNEGLARNLAVIATVRTLFKATRHLIHAQYAIIDGDAASGETVCTAEHRVEGESGDTLLVWAIRYQDRWRREGPVWRFTRRDLIVDWEEVRPVRDVTPASG